MSETTNDSNSKSLNKKDTEPNKSKEEDTSTSITSPKEDNNSKNIIQNINLELITNGKNERGIPKVKFIDDVTTFANSFKNDDGSSNSTASAEVLIGAFTDIFQKYKAYETNLTQKRKYCSLSCNIYLFYVSYSLHVLLLTTLQD